MFCFIFLLIILSISAKIGRSHDVLNTFILVAGSYGTTIRDVFKVSFWGMLTVLILTIFSSLIGILENLAYFRNGTFRYSLGESYPTILSSIVFFICVAFVCWNIGSTNKKKIAITCLTVIASGFLLYIITNTRNDLICSLLLAMVVPWRYYSNFLNNYFFRLIVKIMPTLIFVWTIVSAYFFNPASNMWMLLNRLFSDRLFFVNKAAYQYPVRLFGRYFDQYGNGSSLKTVVNYFFIDSSFSRVLFMNGIITFLLLYIAIQLTFIKLIKKNIPIITAFLLVFIVTMFEGIFSTLFMIIGFNVTLYAFGILFIKKNDKFISKGFGNENYNFNSNT